MRGAHERNHSLWGICCLQGGGLSAPGISGPLIHTALCRTEHLLPLCYCFSIFRVFWFFLPLCLSLCAVLFSYYAPTLWPRIGTRQVSIAQVHFGLSAALFWDWELTFTLPTLSHCHPKPAFSKFLPVFRIGFVSHMFFPELLYFGF